MLIHKVLELLSRISLVSKETYSSVKRDLLCCHAYPFDLLHAVQGSRVSYYSTYPQFSRYLSLLHYYSAPLWALERVCVCVCVCVCVGQTAFHILITV